MTAQDRYRAALRALHELTGTVTLLTATKHLGLSHATVLAALLNEHAGNER